MSTDRSPASRRLPLELTAVFDALDEPVSIFSADGRYVYINPAGETLLGKPAAELIGRSYLDVYPDLATHPYHEAFARLVSGGSRVERLEFHYPPMNRWSRQRLHVVDGYVIVLWQDITATKVAAESRERALTDLKDANEKLLLTSIRSQELVDQAEEARQLLDSAERERAQLLEAEQRARVEAELASRAKDEFLAMLGHELRNPLAPILTALQLMRLRGSPAAERERTVIERQVQHLVRLVDDLLDVSRITRGKVELSRERLDLAEIAAAAIEMSSPLMEQRHQTLSAEVPLGLLVDGDAHRLAQVVSNLLTNAAKYTPPHGRVTITGAREGNEVVLHVTDTGVGIPTDLLPRVFDLFVQGRQSSDRAQGGLGLGLAIVRHLVELHHGHVTATSEGAGLGATFTVRLPAVEGMTTPEETPAGALPSSVSNGKTVLIVDDNADAAELLAEALQALGYLTQTAYDGPSALGMLETFKPDLAVLDIGLPVMDGYELARRLRARPDLNQLRMFAVTGYGQESDRQRAREAGFDAHLTKPVDIRRLAALMEPPKTNR